MKKTLFVLTALFLGAFLLFFPQTSQAVSCKCTIEYTSTAIGDKTECSDLSSGELKDSNLKDCDQFKAKLTANKELMDIVDEISCEPTYADDKCSMPFVAPVTAVEQLKADLSAKKPILEVNIPGLNFNDIKSATDDTGTYFYLPWIPELISALYKFGIAIVSIVASVMIVTQGLRVITSGGGEGKTTAYKKILRSVIGLFIAWGSYAILYTINPALVQFNALKVKVVEEKELAAVLQMMTTQGNTFGTGVGDTPVGSYVPQFPNCPITLDNPLSTDPLSPRTKEFFEKIVTSPLITSAPEKSAERVLRIADAAVVCKVAMGNCGRTAGDIYTLAGVRSRHYPDTSCLTFPGSLKPRKSPGCGTHFSQELRYLPAKVLCDPIITQGGCDPRVKVTTPIGSLVEVQKFIRAANIPGWPDEWAKELRPGDAIWLFNGNQQGGNHSTIFTGWKNGSYEKSGGYIETIDGTAGYNTFRSSNFTCITSQCGDKMMPLIKTFRPK